MTFEELREFAFNKLGISKLADIARELEVTPQVVNNWKSRNQVPYKYVKLIKKKSRSNNVEEKPLLNSKEIILNYSDSDEKELSITEITIFIYNLLVKNLKIALIIPAIFSFFFIIHLKFFTEPIYQSRATILPLTSGSSGAYDIGNVAAQFGISVRGSGKKESTLISGDMFPDIIKSRHLSYELLNQSFYTEKYKENRPLVNILNEIDSDSMFSDVPYKISAVNHLGEIIKIETQKRSPLLVLKVNSFEPKLSYNLANLVLIKLDSLLQSWRLSDVIEKKKFIINRMEMTSKELEKAEESLKVFREKNRSIASSPTLMLEQTRLLRELEVITEVYTTLKSQFEMVQISQYDNSKIMNILDYPEPINIKISPKPVRMFIFYMIFGFSLSVVIIIVREWFIKNQKELKNPLGFLSK